MTPDRMQLLDLVHAVSRGLRRTWMQELTPLGISPHQWRALHIVSSHTEGPLRQRDVADALRIAPRSAAEVIVQLEEAGYLTRRPDPDDKRAVLLSATEAGARVDDQVLAVRESRAHEYFSALDAVQQRDLEALLRTLAEAHPRPEPEADHTRHGAPGSGAC